MKSPAALPAFCAIGLLMAGCKAPTINLGTAEPLKVDIAMRLDVYQHSQTAPTKQQPSIEPDPATRRKNRMADIQTFKNSALIGENREGLVSIRKLPEGEYGAYVQKTVDAENADRLAQMKDLAVSRKTTLAEIQKEQAGLWRNRAFKGELIEVESPPGAWIWQAKEE